ncbi:hypothetical protein [Dickeya chrysanthemi]|uniref:hypothetical protein n=1 Tax=Dickeya chrysanthemi TaxID=556 RepID=UPI0005875EA9|nr:hypothetical protein [Dickeya chrysanthemi]
MSQRLRLAVALLLSGVLSGIAGMLPTLLLHTIHHLIQRLAYGYSVDPIIREDSFFTGRCGAGSRTTLNSLVVGRLGWAV